jgi:flavin reductase (DIM6/NTAB) family NADH-FMN oxidoreductase RutF
MTSDEAAFTRLMTKLEYSLFIVTAVSGEERAGCLIGFASQVSIHPPRFLACLSDKNRTHRVALAASVLAVHMVPEEAEELANLFGGETGDEIDKFARCRWRPGPEGVPILTDLENWFCGRVKERRPFGDHTGFVLEPIEVHSSQGEEPLTFRRAPRIEPGHEP